MILTSRFTLHLPRCCFVHCWLHWLRVRHEQHSRGSTVKLDLDQRSFVYSSFRRFWVLTVVSWNTGVCLAAFLRIICLNILHQFVYRSRAIGTMEEMRKQCGRNRKGTRHLCIIHSTYELFQLFFTSLSVQRRSWFLSGLLCCLIVHYGVVWFFEGHTASLWATCKAAKLF